jgi:AraC-like DNA-binding protein
LGTVNVSGALNESEWKSLTSSLLEFDLILMENKKLSVSNLIKLLIEEILNSNEEYSEINISNYLILKMDMEYKKITRAFSENNQVTLKQYIISVRVKKVMELIMEPDTKLNNISNTLHYSSTAHLCNEFKRVTGMTPKDFVNQQEECMCESYN